VWIGKQCKKIRFLLGDEDGYGQLHPGLLSFIISKGGREEGREEWLHLSLSAFRTCKGGRERGRNGYISCTQPFEHVREDGGEKGRQE